MVVDIRDKDKGKKKKKDNYAGNDGQKYSILPENRIRIFQLKEMEVGSFPY